MENDSLYLGLKNRLCEMIYKGTYKDGENIPPERTLAETLSVSRVTVRKALDLLEKDGIIERVQGSGTQVRLPQRGYKGTMDLIALVAPAGNPFFATFIDYFQKTADKNDSLVLFMQNPRHIKVEDSLFKLFQKNIRNVVVWLEDLSVDEEALRRLRGLGMNIVFFDRSASCPYADCVLLDNNDAIKKLYHYLEKKGSQRIAYIGWDNFQLSSVRQRESMFKELTDTKGKIFHASWKDRAWLADYMKRLLEVIKQEKFLVDAVLCADGELGIALKKASLQQEMQGLIIVSVDDFKEAERLSLSVYRQSFLELAEKVYTSLREQNRRPSTWKAKVYVVKGELVKR